MGLRLHRLWKALYDNAYQLLISLKTRRFGLKHWGWKASGENALREVPQNPKRSVMAQQITKKKVSRHLLPLIEPLSDERLLLRMANETGNDGAGGSYALEVGLV